MAKAIYIVESRMIEGNTYTGFESLQEAQDFAIDEILNMDCDVEIFDWSTGGGAMTQEGRYYKTNLDRGTLEIKVPEKLSQSDVIHIRQYFALIVEQCHRRQEEITP